MKINPLNLPKTDSRKGQEFDPLNPTFHLDADDILLQNNMLTGHMMKLTNDLQKKIVSLEQKFNISNEKQQLEIQIQIDELQRKYEDYYDHLDFCINSMQNAMDIKTEFEPK